METEAGSSSEAGTERVRNTQPVGRKTGDSTVRGGAAGECHPGAEAQMVEMFQTGDVEGCRKAPVAVSVT